MITIVSLGGFCNINTRWLKAVASFKKHFSSLFRKSIPSYSPLFFLNKPKFLLGTKAGGGR